MPEFCHGENFGERPSSGGEPFRATSSSWALGQMNQHFGIDQHFQCVALKLATLLVNRVELAVGDAFPIGWNLLTGDREFTSVTEELLQAALCLFATIECEP